MNFNLIEKALNVYVKTRQRQGVTETYQIIELSPGDFGKVLLKDIHMFKTHGIEIRTKEEED